MTSSSATKYHPIPPDNVNVEDYVPIKLTATNYPAWKRLMLDFVKKQGFHGFLDGSFPPPPKKVTVTEDNQKEGMDNHDYQEWKKLDSLVRGWIMSTVTREDDLVNLTRMETVAEIWAGLGSRYSRPFLKITSDLLEETVKEQEQPGRYLHLYKAILEGDWETANEFLTKEPDAVRARITGYLETALMVAVRSPKRNNIAKKLIALMEPEDLTLASQYGSTALHPAAATGNLEIVKLLLNKNPNLFYIVDKDNKLPVAIAAVNGQRKVTAYLLSVAKDTEKIKPFDSERGNELLHAMLFCRFYDMALFVLERNPKLALEEPPPLLALYADRNAFLSRTYFNFLQRLIYSSMPMMLEKFSIQGKGGGTENYAVEFSSGEKLLHLFWRCAEIIVPQIKNIREKKEIHSQVRQLVRCLCEEAVKQTNLKTMRLLCPPLQMSIQVGIPEIVEEILTSFPGSIALENAWKQSAIQEAILLRHANVFNLIYQFGTGSQMILEASDMSKNTGMHLAACLKPQQKLIMGASANNSALQMQRELQWFKEVERLSLPRDKELKNAEGKTPAMLFTDTHKELVKEGEQWMKDMANSCLFFVTLVVTIVFAAAITVPGGNKDDGLPIFMKDQVFTIFGIADALALFLSVSSLIMFLSILTSRYAEEDFLYALPNKLILGLGTFFFSILALMVAFGAAVYLVLGDKKAWTLISVAALASLPVTIFAFLQFPLLLKIIKTTYFPGNFGRQSDCVLF